MHKWTAKSTASESPVIRLASTIGRATCVLALMAASRTHVIGAPCTPRAIVIGVSIYKDPSWTLLRNAKNDAEAFRDWFQRYTTCGNGAPSGKPIVKLLRDDEASQVKILTALTSELLTAGPDDETFIFISARGLKTTDYREGYILGYDGVRGKLHPSGISIETLRDIIPPRGIGKVFLFADISRDLPNQNEIVSYLDEELGSNPNLAALLSAKPKQVSTEPSEYSRGLFTYSLMQQLSGKPGQKISVDQLYENLKRDVLQASRSKQEPFEFGNGAAVLYLSSNLATKPAFRASVQSRRPFLLLASQQDTLPARVPAEVNRLDEASAFEDEAQKVLLRYGQGNQFPDDPLRPSQIDFERAADLFAKALQRRPALPVPALEKRLRDSLQSRVLFCRGRALAYTARYDDARKTLAEALRADPLMPEPYNAIGITYLEEANYDRALEAFRDSIRIAPDWAYPRHNLALTYIEMGNNTAAEAEYRAAIKKTPEHPYLYYNLGVLLQRLNRRREAEIMFRDAIARFEQQAGAYRTRAARLRAEEPGNLQRNAEANVATEEEQTTTRNEGEAYNALGALRLSQGRTRDARQNFETAWHLNQRLYAARYNLGMLEFQMHHYSSAAQLFQSVSQAAPNFPEAARRLDCARKAVQYAEAVDRHTKQQLRLELKSCSS